MSEFWHVPLNLWKDEPCFIIGGGPSLKQFNCCKIQDKGRTIAVNCAGITIAKWADILYWSDYRWYEWNRVAVNNFEQTKITRLRDTPHFTNKYKGIPDIKVIKFNSNMDLSKDPTRVGGYCSGSTALNLAVLYGCNPIYLLGMDMQSIKGESNFHNMHVLKTTKERYKKSFIPVFDRMAVDLKILNIDVFTVSTNTALKCFPILTYEELLSII